MNCKSGIVSLLHRKLEENHGKDSGRGSKLLSIARADNFSEIYFITSKRSQINGKATHFEVTPKASVCYFLEGDSVTLVGNVEFVEDKETQAQVWNESDRRFFKRGIEDPKFRLLKFHTIEATFWIEGKFRTCKYK